MSRESAARRASACFAVARSATIDGEHQAAIARGMALIERHGLDPDSFDIPGRSRSRPIPASNVRWSSIAFEAEDIATALRTMAEALTRAGFAAGAAAGETPYDARRRNFDQAADEARQRDRQRQNKGRVDYER